MQGSAAALGAPVQMQLAGRSWTARGRTLAHLAEIEQHLLRRRPQPLRIAREGLAWFDGQPEMQRELLRLALVEARRLAPLDDDELAAWSQSREGFAFQVWQALRQDAPQGLTWDAAQQLVEQELVARGYLRGAAEAQAWMDDVLAAIDRATGADVLGNSGGQTPAP